MKKYSKCPHCSGKLREDIEWQMFSECELCGREINLSEEEIFHVAIGAFSGFVTNEIVKSVFCGSCKHAIDATLVEAIEKLKLVKV